MILEVKDLVVSYGAIRAVKGISFHVEKGDVITLIGANGAGKTTTLKTISGLLRPESGSIILNGVDITEAPPHKIVEMGISHVPEGRGIFSNLTGEENLPLAPWVPKKNKTTRREDYDRVYSIFPRLLERRRQPAGTLSGGEQQMLAVGRALMTKGEILLLDEPSMGLAPVLVDEIFRVIKEINAMGTTILLVEQNAYKALEIAKTAYCLETGVVKISGAAAELKQQESIKKAYLGG